ncbi:MAG TPA: MFS transporter [Rhizobiales bacterium]|nr:MFS transporter [Hyphomicrobiales bacterium]
MLRHAPALPRVGAKILDRKGELGFKSILRGARVTSIIERLTGLQGKGQGPAFLVASGHAATHWIIGTFYVLLPYITAELGLTYAQAGGLVSVFHAAAFAANAGSGAVVDIRGRRVLVQSAALVAGAASLMAMGLADRALWLIPLVVLIGVTNNLWHPAAISYLSKRYPGNRGYALSIHTLGASLGDVVAPVAAGAALLWLSWQGVSSLMSLPVFGVAALLLLTLNALDREESRGAGAGSGLGEYFRGVAALVRNRAVIGLCAMAGFRSMTQSGLLVFLPLYLADVLKVSPVVLGVALMSMQLGGMIAGPVAGVASDRIGRQPVTFLCLSAATVMIAALTFVEGIVAFVAVVSVLGLALFAVRPVIHSWALDLAPGNMSGSVVSLLFGTQSALSALVPVLGGLIADQWGLRSVFYVLAATMLIANVLVYFQAHKGRAPG